MARPYHTVVNHTRPRSRSAFALGSVVLVATVAFLCLLGGVIARDQLVRADVAISHFLQELRTPWADAVMVVFTSLGDTIVITAVAAACIGWMLWWRAWSLAAGLIAALLIAEAFVYLLKAALQLPRPVHMYVGADSYSFPSGHATLSATLFGILAWLIVATMPSRRRIVGLAVTGSLVGAIATSRLYLAAHWPSDVAAGLLIGAVLSATFGLAFRKTDLTALHSKGLMLIAAATLLTVGFWHAVASYDINMATYGRRAIATSLSQPSWRVTGLERLPER